MKIPPRSRAGTARAKNLIAVLLALGLCLGAAGCSSSGEGNGYRMFGNMGSEQYVAAFRDGDPVRDIMVAGMMTLAADGTIAQLSLRWFGDGGAVSIPASTEVAGWLDNQPQRTFILGYYEGACPMCFSSGGQITGFDAEMFTEICSRLGWEIRFQAIAPGTAGVELASGNVDCVAGGFGTGEDTSGLSLSPEYLSAEYVFVSRTDSDIKRRGQLDGRILGVVSGSAPAAALNADADFSADLGSLLVLASEQECFEALDAGLCDAILITSTCAEYHIG